MAETLPTSLQLEIVTPDRQVVREAVGSVSIPGKHGYLGILPGHAPLLSELRAGELSYTRDARTHYLAVSWGFAEVLPDRVIILAHTAERVEEIDLERVERARQRAQARLTKYTDSETDFERAQGALERALARRQVAERAKK